MEVFPFLEEMLKELRRIHVKKTGVSTMQTSKERYRDTSVPVGECCAPEVRLKKFVPGGEIGCSFWRFPVYCWVKCCNGGNL